MPPNKLLCVCCNSTFDKQFVVSCTVCHKTYRNTCVNITNSELRIVNMGKGYDWSCTQCRNIKCDMNDLKSLIVQLQEEVRTLRTSQSQHINIDPDHIIEEVVVEVNQRSLRRKNLVIHGILESDNGLDVSVKRENDKKAVQSVLNLLDNSIDSSDIKPIRLGKFSNGRNRLIKISLRDEDQVHNAIKSAHKLKGTDIYKKVFVSFDRTPLQLRLYKELKEDLIKRQNEGIACKIKFFNGTPKIVENDNLN